jgi:nitrite reductase (NO-forming)
MIVITRRSTIFGAALSAACLAGPGLAQVPNLPRKKIDLVAPPFVHPHEQTTSKGPMILEFRLVVEEKERVIDESGTKLQAMSFNGSIPGPMMVVHEGDYVARLSVLRTTRCRTTSTSMPLPARWVAAT